MKVTFIHPDLGIGGAERLILDVAVALKKKNHTPVFYTNHCDKNHAFEEIKTEEFPVTVICDWLPRHLSGRFQALCAYVRMVFLAVFYVCFASKEEQSDVFFVDQIPVAVPFLKLTGKPVVYYCHHPDLLASASGGRLKKMYRAPIDWVEEKCTGRADILLVNSRYTASVFRKTFPSIAKPIAILYPTIAEGFNDALSKLSNAKPLNELIPELNNTKFPSDAVIFLSINRFHPAKNLELAVNAFETLKRNLSSDDFNKIHLVITGGYDPHSRINETCFSSLVSLANTKNVQNQITFLKSPSDELKAELLLTCNCLVYTPVNEHFGIVPLEAMAAGKPVLACNNGGPCETVEHGVTGFLCEPTPESLGSSMQKLMDRKVRETMGAEGRKRLDAQFSHVNFVEKVESVVQDAVLRCKG